MGVSAYFYGYDEIWFQTNYRQPITIDLLSKAQIVSADMEVSSDGSIESLLSGRVPSDAT
jgi:hypothetical protein